MHTVLISHVTQDAQFAHRLADVAASFGLARPELVMTLANVSYAELERG